MHLFFFFYPSAGIRAPYIFLKSWMVSSKLVCFLLNTLMIVEEAVIGCIGPKILSVCQETWADFRRGCCWMTGWSREWVWITQDMGPGNQGGKAACLEWHHCGQDGGSRTRPGWEGFQLCPEIGSICLVRGLIIHLSGFPKVCHVVEIVVG